VEYKMEDANSSCLRGIHPIQGAYQLVYSVEGLKFSIESTHRKLSYHKAVTGILVFCYVCVVA
jgi:hypothetical protein